MATVEIMSINLEEDEAIQFAAKAAAIQYQLNNGRAEELEEMFIGAVMNIIGKQLMGEKKSSFKELNEQIFQLVLLNHASFNSAFQKLAVEAEDHMNKQTKH
ncbi:hypothetical protein LGN04_01920 [Burkholderia multivorans]|nr:hypothetical protein [Burkholderia multivorans]